MVIFAARQVIHAFLKDLHVNLTDYRWHFACGYSMVTSSHLSVPHFQFHNVAWQNNLFKTTVAAVADGLIHNKVGQTG